VISSMTEISMQNCNVLLKKHSKFPKSNENDTILMETIKQIQLKGKHFHQNDRGDLDTALECCNIV